MSALYYAACRADDKYQTELERVYGAKACDARYQAEHPDWAVIEARLAKYAADADWRESMRRGLNTSYYTCIMCGQAHKELNKYLDCCNTKHLLSSIELDTEE